MYDLIIVGAGPAGIFALELLRKSSTPPQNFARRKGQACGKSATAPRIKPASA